MGATGGIENHRKSIEAGPIAVRITAPASLISGLPESDPEPNLEFHFDQGFFDGVKLKKSTSAEAAPSPSTAETPTLNLRFSVEPVV